MRKTNMMLVLCLTTSLIASAAAQAWTGAGPGSGSAAGSGCIYKHDKTSPFHWDVQDYLCTDSMCADQNIDCQYPYADIQGAIRGHYLRTGVDIRTEVQILERHFNNSFPPEFFHSTNKYTCQGVCDRPVVSLERIFFDYVQRDSITKQVLDIKERELCFVIGPKLYYTGCSGEPCHIKGMMQVGTDQYNCVPNVKTSVTVWLYCPNVVTGSCIKTTIDIPMSCSCVRFNCPYSSVKTAAIPSPGQGLGRGIGDLLSGLGISGSDFGHGDPFASGADPSGSGSVGGGPFASRPVGGDPFASGPEGGNPFPAGPVPVDVGSLQGGGDHATGGWSDSLGPAGMHVDQGRGHSIV